MRRYALGLLLLCAACGGSSADDGAKTSGGTSSGTSGTDGTGTTTDGGTETTDGSTTTEASTDTGECWQQDMECQFTPCPDFDLEPIACDPFTQDCPDGERCTLVAEDTYDFTVACAAVVANPKQLGEPCTRADFMDNPVDDCDFGLVCRGNPWFSRDMDVAPVCRPMCTGSEADPQCPDGMFCELESVPACYSPSDCNG